MPISPRCGTHLVHAPEEVVGELRRVRRLEAGDPHAHGVEPAEAVLDGSVLARGVHALQDDEHRALVLGHQHRRELGHALGAPGRALARRRLVAQPEACVGPMRRPGRPSSPGRCAWRGQDPAWRATIRDRLRRERDELDAIAERVVDEHACQAREVRVAPRRTAGRLELRDQLCERRGVAQAEGGVRLRRRREGLADAHVELLRPAGEPAAAARLQRSGFLELGQTEQAAVEPARCGLAAGEPPPARDRCRPPGSLDDFAAALHQHHVPPGLAELAQALARADRAEAAALVQRDARRVLGEDPRLQRPDACPLGALDERAQQAASDALAARLLGDVDRLPATPR